VKGFVSAVGDDGYLPVHFALGERPMRPYQEALDFYTLDKILENNRTSRCLDGQPPAWFR